MPLVGLVLIIAIGVVLLVLQFQKTLLQQRSERHRLELQHREALLQQSIAAQEKERQRIATDLHDELGALLSMSLMQLKHYHSEQPLQVEKWAHRFPSIEQHLERALGATRRIAHELKPPYLEEMGIAHALENLLNHAAQTGAITIEMQSLHNCAPLAAVAQLSLYRIVSELLNNTLKHAEAQKVRCYAHQDAAWLIFQYADDGKGLTIAPTKYGLGIQSMKSRAEAMGGTFEIQNGLSSGILAKIKLPLNNP